MTEQDEASEMRSAKLSDRSLNRRDRTMSRQERAKLVVDTIIIDMRDRGGLRQMWDGIDENTQTEIRQTWEGIVFEALASV